MNRRATPASVIASRTALVEGTRLHYLMAGHGPTVILLHGYAETSRMWKPLIPRLAERFTVIAPDLPGIGDSKIPKDGLDMKTSAIRVHALAKALGSALAEQAKAVADDTTAVILKDTGHWVMEERPKETMDALVKFL